MAMKDFDLKQFMLQKGEKVALYAAAGFMLLLIALGLGLQGLGSGSAATTADELIGLKTKGESAVNASQPRPGLDTMKPELRKAGTLASINPDSFACAHPFFVPSALDDSKWRKPEILGPDEFQVDVMRCLVRSFVFSKADGKLSVLFLEPGANQTAPKTQQPQVPALNPQVMRMLQLRGIRPGPGGPGGPGVNLPGGNPTPAPAGGGDTDLYVSRWVPVEMFAKNQRQKGFPAEATSPQRIAVIQAAFPYEKQLEAFRYALRYEDIAHMQNEAAFEFVALKVQRRSVRPDGSGTEWKDIDIIDSVRSMLTFGVDPEDPLLVNYGIVWTKDRLVVPRPMLARGQEYPKPDRLKSITDTMMKMDEAMKRGQAAQPVQTKTKFDGDFDVFQLTGDPNGLVQQPVQPRQPEQFPAGGELTRKTVYPEKCLVRFLDPSIEPGYTYEYRLKVVMANPLYQRDEQAVSKNLTKDKTIEASSWTMVPDKVKVDAEFAYYALGENFQRPRMLGVNDDRTWVQVHRWFDWVDIQGARYPVGDWSIAEQLPIHRGEYIGKVQEVEVPVWDPKQAGFRFAVAPDRIKRKKRGFQLQKANGIPVDFSTSDLLVDFEGGKQEANIDRGSGRTARLQDEGGMELLILGADGKLRVRSSDTDFASDKRKTRLENWKTWLDNVRRNAANMGQKPDEFFNPNNRGS